MIIGGTCDLNNFTVTVGVSPQSEARILPSRPTAFFVVFIVYLVSISNDQDMNTQNSQTNKKFMSK